MKIILSATIALVTGGIGVEPLSAGQRRAKLALVGDGLFAAGRIVSGAEGGRVFRASRVYLRGRQPPG